MFGLTEILAYAVFTGSEFAVLCAMTRSGRGWPWRIAGLAVLVAVDVVAEWCWRLKLFPLDQWLALCFATKISALAALIFCLSRDSPGRRAFLAITYGAYAACFAAMFHLIAYRNVFRLPGHWSEVIGDVDVAVMNLVFVVWILPWLPQDSRKFSWRDPCLVAGMLFVLLYASCYWPDSIVSEPLNECVMSVLVAITAWVVFPMICRSVHKHLRSADVEYSLKLMMAEMKVRRAAIEAGRRIQHDQRHHRAQIAEYMLSGQHDNVFAYLKELDEEAKEEMANKFVWCENETVNAILSGCARKATARGVDFSAEVAVEPTLPLPDVELVAVVANLVENAINAAEKLEKSTSTLDFDSAPKVTCYLRQRALGLGITVTNPVPEGFALTAKGLPCEEPGVGMESVRRVVEKHEGKWVYELVDGILMCQAVLIFK